MGAHGAGGVTRAAMSIFLTNLLVEKIDTEISEKVLVLVPINVIYARLCYRKDITT